MISNVPSREDLSLYRGDSFPMAWTMVDDTTGVAVNITGRAFVMVLRRFDDDVLVATISGVITNAVAGNFSINILPATTDALDPRVRYSYDVRETNGTIVRTLVRGRVIVVEDTAEAQ